MILAGILALLVILALAYRAGRRGRAAKPLPKPDEGTVRDAGGGAASDGLAPRTDGRGATLEPTAAPAADEVSEPKAPAADAETAASGPIAYRGAAGSASSGPADPGAAKADVDGESPEIAFDAGALTPSAGAAEASETALERAERLGDVPGLARALIEAGEEALAAQNVSEARPLLQRALDAAHRCGDPEIQALARLNLGDLALAENDLTSACEHWQIARQFFEHTGRHEAERAAEERMRRTQCPTDWVLTDF